MVSVVDRFYGIHAYRDDVVYADFRRLINDLPRVMRWEDGEDINATNVDMARKLTAEQFAKAVIDGKLKPDALVKERPELTPEQKESILRATKAMFGGH